MEVRMILWFPKTAKTPLEESRERDGLTLWKKTGAGWTELIDQGLESVEEAKYNSAMYHHDDKDNFHLSVCDRKYEMTFNSVYFCSYLSSALSCKHPLLQKHVIK